VADTGTAHLNFNVRTCNPVSTLTSQTGRIKEYDFATRTLPVHSSLLKLFYIT